MKRLNIILVMALLSTSVFGIEKVFKSLPVRTSLVAKFDLDSIKKIAFVNSFLNDPSNTKLAEVRSAIQTYAGLDLMEVEQLWAIAGTEDEFMFIAQGGFETLPVEKSLRKLNNYVEVKMDGVHFAGLFDDEDKPGKKNLIAILDDKTVILGEQGFCTKYLEIFTGKKTGLDTKGLKIVQSLERSKNLVHAKTVNLYIPPKDRANPVLNNIKSAEMVVDQNSKYLTARLDADVKDPNAVAIINLFLSEFIKKAKKNQDPRQNPIVKEGMKNASVKASNNAVVVQTKFSLATLELIVGDQLKGLEAIFE